MIPTKMLCEVFEWGSNLGVTTSGSVLPEGAGDICYAPDPGSNSDRPRQTDRANMHLIADAFNIYFATGLTPSQLLEKSR